MKNSLKMITNLRSSFAKRVSESMMMEETPIMGFQNAAGEAIDIQTLSDPSMKMKIIN